MTNNRKIELCQLACKNYKNESIKHCKMAYIQIVIALIALISIALFTSIYSNSNFNPAILCTLVIAFGIQLIFYVFMVIVNCQAVKSFVELINQQEYEIVEKTFDGDSWYCVHILGTNEFIRAEKVNLNNDLVNRE